MPKTNIKISVCITVLDEDESVGKLLESLLKQSKKPDEIIIVDGGSLDDTVKIIDHYQKRSGMIKLLKENSSRSQGRNLGVEMAEGKIIAMTDAGCVADKDWLKNITLPFASGADVSAGFYKMTHKSAFAKAASRFLGVLPKEFDADFLPSTRSIAFTKEIWERTGGFSENLEGAAEDTVFNLKLINAGARFARVKNATVEWGMPGDIEEFFWKVYGYAKGDAKSKIWLFPGKGITSHNIKAISVISRYLVGLYFLYLVIIYSLLPYFAVTVFAYIFWSFRKIILAFGDYKAAIWGPLLQVVSDLGVMAGFFVGFFGKKNRSGTKLSR